MLTSSWGALTVPILRQCLTGFSEPRGTNTSNVFRLDIGIINPRGASNSTYINAIPGRGGLTEDGHRILL